MTDNELPPLPYPTFLGVARGGLLREDGFTAEDMHTYARAALALNANTTDFEAGRQQGMAQERALSRLSASTEEIEAAAGFCRLAWGSDAAVFNDGVDALADRLKQLAQRQGAPVARIHRGGTDRFGRACVLMEWLPGSEALADGNHLVYTAPATAEQPAEPKSAPGDDLADYWRRRWLKDTARMEKIDAAALKSAMSGTEWLPIHTMEEAADFLGVMVHRLPLIAATAPAPVAATQASDELERQRIAMGQERTPAYGDALALCRRLEAAAAAPVAEVLTYTTAIGEAGQAYVDRFKPYMHSLPATFRWEELWNALVAAAMSAAPPAGLGEKS